MEFFTHVTLLASLAVVAVQQILKLNIVPIAFANRYPVLANIILSAAASVFVVWTNYVQPNTIADWILLIATTSVVAAITYNATLRNWTQLRGVEGEGKVTSPAQVSKSR